MLTPERIPGFRADFMINWQKRSQGCMKNWQMISPKKEYGNILDLIGAGALPSVEGLNAELNKY